MGVRRVLMLIFTIMMITGVSIAVAHVPRTAEENESLETAMVIEDPIKSWAIYSELLCGEVANYFEMEMEEGERLYLNLLTSENKNFVPSLAVMGPGIDVNESTPDFVERPPYLGVKVIEGVIGEKEYEPFTPGSYYHPARFDEKVDESGTYYVVVYNEEETGGNYGLAVGYQETWSPIEWIKLPLDVVNIRIWEGQSIWHIFTPMITVLTVGFSWTCWKYYNNGWPKNTREWCLITSSLLYIGSGAMMVMQMIIASNKSSPGLAVIVTIIFASLPLILGYKLWQKSLDFKRPEKWDRVKVIVYGLLGFLVWAGLVIGPIIALSSALLPSREA